MPARKRLTALAGLGLIVCLALSHGCDILNPEYVAGNGGDPIPASANITGYVLIVLNNLTEGGVALNYEFDFKEQGQSAIKTDGGIMSIGLPSYFAMTVPCGTSEIRLLGLDYVGPGTIDPDAGEDDAGNVTLPTDTFSAPLLKCGSVIFVTVTESTAGGVIADVQMLN